MDQSEFCGLTHKICNLKTLLGLKKIMKINFKINKILNYDIEKKNQHEGILKKKV